MLPNNKPEDVVQLAERVTILEKRLEAWTPITYQVERLIIEKLMAEKVEINLEAIDINELSGILNIGQSYDSTIVRQTPSQELHTKEPPSPRSAKAQNITQIRIKPQPPLINLRHKNN